MLVFARFHRFYRAIKRSSFVSSGNFLGHWYFDQPETASDINEWFTRLGLFDTEVEELKSPRDKFASHPQISGKNEGQSLNLHQFARDGVLLSHVREARDGKLVLAPDLIETLAKVDRFEADALQRVDDYIARTGLIAPVESVPQLRDGYEQVKISELDLKASGISTGSAAHNNNSREKFPYLTLTLTVSAVTAVTRVTIQIRADRLWEPLREVTKSTRKPRPGALRSLLLSALAWG